MNESLQKKIEELAVFLGYRVVRWNDYGLWADKPGYVTTVFPPSCDDGNGMLWLIQKMKDEVNANEHVLFVNSSGCMCFRFVWDIYGTNLHPYNPTSHMPRAVVYAAHEVFRIRAMSEADKKKYEVFRMVETGK